MNITEILHILGIAAIPFVIGTGAGFYWGFRMGFPRGYDCAIGDVHNEAQKAMKEVLDAIKQVERSKENANDQQV